MADTRRYFAQVGRESIEVDPAHVALQRKGARMETSRPVSRFTIRLTRVAKDKSETVYEGEGPTWDAAEKSLDEQLPKGNA